MIKLYPDRPFIFDGAFGTCYASLHPDNAPCELANIQHPERVIALHREYISAGADAVKTDSFTLNPVNFPDAAQLRALIAGAISCAKTAAENKVAVFADLGTIPDGTPEDYIALVKLFIECGAENFIFETLAEFDPVSDALTYIRDRLPEAGIIVSFGASPDGYTRHGNALSELIAEAAAHPATDAVGFNCICGPSHSARLAASLKGIKKPLCVLPNAGYPVSVNGRTVYNDNIDYFASKVKEIAACGVSIVGGCCGTTPEHIAAIVSALADKSSAVTSAAAPDNAETEFRENELLMKFRSGKRVVAVEFDPPVSSELSATASAALEIKKTGCDVITFADNPLSRARADSIMTAAYVRERTDVDVIPHLTCRDRNHIAIKSALLAANGMGVRNVLAVTGDPLSDDSGKGVFALNSYKLIGYISSLNESDFAASPFSIGGALNLCSVNFDAELSRAKEKIKRGADYFLTQPVTSERTRENLKKAHAELEAPILAGIYPVAGYKNALFLKNEVAGIEIPDELLAALEGKSREEAAAVSVRYAADIAESVSEYCAGYYLMTPLKRVDIITALIRELKGRKLI